MFRKSMLMCLIAAGNLAFASTPPVTYTGGAIGKEIIQGDFPAVQTTYSWYGVPLAHGDDGYWETLSTIHITGLSAITSPVDYAEISLSVHSYTTSPDVPGFRVHARKAVSPANPSSGAPQRPSAYYSSGAGWTTAYVSFNPVDNDTGTHRLDVTALVNELAAQSGGTGTSITFIMEPTHTPNETSSVNMRFSGNPALTVYPDLDDRDYQRKAIAGGKTIFFMPLDATDLGTNGSTVNDFRVVVADSSDGIDQTTTTAESTIEGISRTQDYSLEITTAVTELTTEYARKLVAPFDPSTEWYSWPVLTSTHSYLLVAQFVQMNSTNKFSWDTFNDVGFQMYLSEGNGKATFSANAETATNQISFPTAYRNYSGEIKTMCVYYDAAADKVYAGYHNGESGTPMAWTAGQAAAGLNFTYNVSGFAFPDGNKLQAVAAFDWSTTRRVSEVKSAIERARVLWSSGVKSLPPMLY